MSISNRLLGFASCRSFLPLALAALAGLSTSAIAQTPAPQLLPYTVKLIAGGGTKTIAAGATCPVSGFTSTDAYGDGCLATEIEIGNTASGGTTPGARGAVVDSKGNVFFTDYSNGLVRRVDAITGIVTAVAGGGTAAAGTSSGAQANTVKLSHPAGIAFAPNGDLYFSDTGNGQVFKVAATGGFITTTGTLTLMAGNSGGTYGYAASNATTTITSANSYLRAPYGIAFDTLGDLFIVDEYTEAILVLNTSANTNTVNGVSVAPGTIWKIAGTSTGSTAPYCVNGTASGYGCNFALYKENVQANTTPFESTYSVTVDPTGTVYAGVEYYDSAFKITPSGVLSTFAGIQNTVGVKPTIGSRGKAGSFGIGSIFGIAADANSNVYITDASSGVIWRVDGASQSMYVVAGGATTFCSGATDAYGDGCPAKQAKFGSSGSTNYATATLPGPGIYAVSVDQYSNLYTGDTELNLIREVSSGTQFGTIGANQPIQTVDIHFASGDSPSTATYTLTAGASNFSLGTAVCGAANSDGTTDCLLPITATPSALGLFTGTLQVASTVSGTASFPLSGTYVESPITRTSVSYVATGVTCTGTSTYSTTTPIVTTAKVVANGPNPPSGTITFYANGAQIGTQSITNLGTTAIPAYGATLSYTFAAVGTYNITATYGGDNYFKPSTSSAATVTASNPTFTASTVNYQQNTVVAGQTGLYSFNLIQNVYNGTITLACSGLPANSSCSFSPTTVTAAGCSTSSTVALSINTQQGTKNGVATSSLGGPGRGPWAALGMIPGLLMALLIGLRRRRVPMRYGQLWMALALLLATSGTIACNGNVQVVPATPSGSYNITVTATGTTGTVASFTVPLTVK